MPDLLAHVASDHLGAPGFPSEVPAPLNTFQVPALPMNAANATLEQSTPLPTASSAATQDPLALALADQTNAFNLSANQELLSCLWDDCLQMPDCKVHEPNACPTAPAHPLVQHSHAHNHRHTNAAGEPLSPQTMLRHVLEEHLGVPGSIIGWGNNGPQNTMHMGQTQVKEQPVYGIKNHLPTPSSTQHTPSPPPGKSLVCLWPGCTHLEAFADSGALMEHLSNEHVGKGKDSYTCHWDVCDRTFRSRQKVLRHLQSHTGHRPFVCSVCEQAFGEAAPLAAHMRRHAQESESSVLRSPRLHADLQNLSNASTLIVARHSLRRHL